jgi:hypothetical protein
LPACARRWTCCWSERAASWPIPRYAALLARRLIEYKVSAVIDPYELKLAERRQFVKLFLDSLIHMPRELWRPTLVLLDEAHIYCPERGSGDAESTEPVISLMSQGRKRGYAGIIATQRLSKSSQGPSGGSQQRHHWATWLDADQARAGDALGLSKADRLKLRDLKQGEFYAFGPAFNRSCIVRFRSDRVRTIHPRPGERHLLTAPAPSKAIRGVLGKFADLPHEVEAEIRGLDEARRRIAELERQMEGQELEFATTVRPGGYRTRRQGCRREGASCVETEIGVGRARFSAKRRLSGAAIRRPGRCRRPSRKRSSSSTTPTESTPSCRNCRG